MKENNRRLESILEDSISNTLQQDTITHPNNSTQMPEVDNVSSTNSLEMSAIIENIQYPKTSTPLPTEILHKSPLL